MKEKFSFTKDYTAIIKGVAILLMLFHHFFGFPEWYVEGVSYIGIPFRVNTAEYVIGQFGHICVAIFAFLTGYGMFFSYKSGNTLKTTLKKLVTFLISYWLILFGVVIPINLALGKTDITLSLILQNMVAYDCSLVTFGWYVRFYIEIMLTLPIFYKLMSKKAYITIPIFLLLPALINYRLGQVPGTSMLVIRLVFFTMEYFLWLPCVLVGLCFARYKLFDKIGILFEKLKKYELPVCVILMLILMYLRAYKEDTVGVMFSFDVIYVPIFIFLCCRIISVLPGYVKSAFSLLGNHSMNIWFLHSLFFSRTAILMKYAFAPKISVLIILWVILLCLPLSTALNSVSALIFKKRR
ncbi:MAG: acyltransferase [Ruminococcaceae bacterium]|nr:acyltransferase [Oscillospiraceae bacterium]